MVKGSFQFKNIIRLLTAFIELPFFILGYIVPRNKKLWVFGYKKFFGDNPRYLMEFINEHYPEIRTIWLARTAQCRNKVRKLGFESETILSIRGMYYAFRAGYGIVAEGFGDINRAAINGMKVIHLYHGAPMKRILLDFPKNWQLIRNPLGNLANKITKWILRQSLRQVDLVTASSRIIKERYESAFGIDPSKIVITGFARDDIILSPLKKYDYKQLLNIPAHSKIILYAPTWREGKWPKMKENGFDPIFWNTMLKEYDAYLTLKVHPVTEESVLEQCGAKSENQIRIISNKEHPDINYLLRQVDILISDYSGTVYDFALLERPIIFFAPDYEEYTKTRPIYGSYKEVTGGKYFKTWAQLGLAVRDCLDGKNTTFLQNVRRIKTKYNAFNDTNNCERIYRSIINFT